MPITPWVVVLFKGHASVFVNFDHESIFAPFGLLSVEFASFVCHIDISVEELLSLRATLFIIVKKLINLDLIVARHLSDLIV